MNINISEIEEKSEEVQKSCLRVNRPVYVRAKDAKAWEDFSIFIYSPDDNIWKNPFTSETILDNGYH